MAERDGVLRLKLAARAGAPPGQMSAEKAMAVAFGRAGREVPGLGLRMAGFVRERLDLTDLGAAFAPGSLAMLLVQRGPDEPEAAKSRPGSPPRRDPAMFTSSRVAAPKAPVDEPSLHGGLIIADTGLVTALVEARMTGHVSPAEPAPRAATRIDGLIVAGLVDAALAQFDLLVPDLSIARAVSNWQAGAMVPSAAAARLTLKEGLFIAFSLDFELGESGRLGRLTLAMPEAPPRREEDQRGEKGAADLAQIVLQTRGDLRAVLTRLQVPLSRLSQWEAGHTIPIPRSALTGVRIEDIEGELVGRGRLGQLSGARAVRLSPEAASLPEPEFALPAAAPALPDDKYGSRF